jgi:O-antigen/teichoic acid export membrane protein
MTHAAPTRIDRFATTMRRPGMGRTIVSTAGFNIMATIASGLTGIILARALGPTIRGEYAAITAWFGIALVIGQMGQPAALCFYVAREPGRAREYVATSRSMTLTTGVLIVIVGIIIAPLLAKQNSAETLGYRIAFGASIIAFVCASYTFSLQARDLRRWNLVRVSQPALSLIAIIMLWRVHLLALPTALGVLAVTMTLQLLYSYLSCRRAGLAPGHTDIDLVRPLAVYGVAQIAALAPAALNTQLDQIILSQTVPYADLGRYAIAVSLTLLPVPLVSAIGYVVFPRLASERVVTTATHAIQRFAVLGSAAVAVSMLTPMALAAYWVVPLIFGNAYRGAVPMIWILTPGAVFLACGQVTGDVLRGRNRPIIVARAQGLAAVFTVVMLLALLPLLGVYGAAIASTVAYGIALVVMLWAVWHLPSPIASPTEL